MYFIVNIFESLIYQHMDFVEGLSNVYPFLLFPISDQRLKVTISNNEFIITSAVIILICLLEILLKGYQ